MSWGPSARPRTRRLAARWRQAAGRNLVVELVDPGSRTVPGPILWRSGRVLLTAVVIATNLVGVAAVLVAAFLVVPLPPVHSPGHVRIVDAVAAGIYVAAALPLGAWAGTRGLLPVRRWLVAERPARPAEQRMVIRAPLRLFVLQLALWFGAAVLFAILDSRYSGALGLAVMATIAISGMTTAACAYLLAERVLRPAAVRALSGGMPDRLAVPGVAGRAVLAWALGSGLPVLAIIAIGILYLSGNPATASQLGVAMVAIGSIAIAVGLLAVTLAARASAAPLDAVRRALERVQRGEYDVRVAVYDGTQIGKLQLGFNSMVEGLAERERLREAFGTYVDPDVADRILGDVGVEGEVVEVTVMFVDVRGFTAFAEQTPAPEVVAALNRLFEQLVPVVHSHGGRVDKFVGDGLLAVFGAPRRLPDHAARAVHAALDIARRVDTGAAGDLRIGVGLNSGPVVAGNLGGAGRLEFSVIGDPVNVAARVEAATRQTGDPVLIAERTKDLAGPGPWRMVERPGVPLKGKTEKVRIYCPEPVPD